MTYVIGILIAFALTAAIECAVMFVLFKKPAYVYYVFLCNLLTNPALNLGLLLVQAWLGRAYYGFFLLVFEIAAVFVEGAVLYHLTPLSLKKSLGISLLLNAVSFAAGLLFFHLFRLV